MYASSPNGLRAQAVAAADEIVEDGRSTLVIGLDSLPSLNDATVSALILASRKLRTVGGSVRLVTQSPDHRKNIATSGLDRIFEVFSSTEEAVHPAAPGTKTSPSAKKSQG